MAKGNPNRCPSCNHLGPADGRPCFACRQEEFLKKAKFYEQNYPHVLELTLPEVKPKDFEGEFILEAVPEGEWQHLLTMLDIRTDSSEGQMGSAYSKTYPAFRDGFSDGYGIIKDKYGYERSWGIE